MTTLLSPVKNPACRNVGPLMLTDADWPASCDAAIAVCHSCPDLRVCREWATQVPDPVPYHVAGGLAPWERPGSTARAQWNARRKLNLTAVKAS